MVESAEFHTLYSWAEWFSGAYSPSGAGGPWCYILLRTNQNVDYTFFLAQNTNSGKLYSYNYYTSAWREL